MRKRAIIAAVLAALVALPATAQANAGDLDQSFGSGGVVVTPLPANAFVAQVLVLPDGRIVAGGSAGTGREFTLVRYLPNGTPDPSFGTGGDGIVTTAIGAGGGFLEDMVLQGDKVVAAGTTFSGSNSVVTLARYNPDGSLDSSFQGGGFFQAASSVGREGTNVAVQPDGKIVVGGWDQGFMVARFNADGMGLDTTFDGDGVAGVPGNVGECGSGSPDGVIDMALVGSFIVASGGCDGKSSTPEKAGILRYLTGTTANNGALDTSFGAGGAATVRVDPSKDSFAVGFGVQSDGKFVQNIQSGFTNVGARLALARWNPDGTLDSGFGSGGITGQFDFGGTDGNGGSGLAVGPSDLLYAGGTRNPEGGFGLARLTSVGALDPSFGSGGKVLQPLGSPTPPMMSPSNVATVVAQSDGKVVEGGNAYMNGKTAFALMRFETVGAGPRVALGTVKVSGLRYNSHTISDRIRCRRSPASSCAGLLELFARARSAPSQTAGRKKRRLVKIASATFSVPAGQTASGRMRPTRRGRKALRHRRRLKVTVRLSNPTTGERATARATVRIKRKKHR